MSFTGHPSVARSVPVPSGQDWNLQTMPSGSQFCLFADDGIYAQPVLTANNAFKTGYLQANNFNFNVPTGQTVVGIEVIINRFSDGGMSNTSSISDLTVSLCDSGGNIFGQNKALSGLWPLTLTQQQYGSSVDMWGTTFGNNGDGGISMVNASGFGVMLSINEAAGGVGQDNGNVDSITMLLFTSNQATKISGVIPLFIHGYDTFNQSVPLFTSSSTSFSGGIPLYTYGLASGNSNIPLFLSCAAPISGNLPLYIDGGPHISKCYSPVYPSVVSAITGITSVQWSNLSNIYAFDNTRTTCSMTSGNAQSSQISSFFSISGISTQTQVSGVIFNFYKQQNIGDDSVIDRQVFLIRNGIVESGVNYAAGIWGTDEHNPVSYSITTDQNGNPLQISDVTASGFGVLMQAGTNNFGGGTAQIDTVSCTLCATIPGITSSFPLFLNVSNSANGSLPLFIHANTSFSGNLPLYIHGLDSFSGNIPLFINGLLSNSGSIPLYLQSNAFGSGSLPLFTSASVGDSGGITLYLQGQPTYPENNSLPLYLGNFSSSGNLDSLRRSIPLYLDSHDFNGGITLYLGVSNIGTPNDSITLFTKGAAFNSAGSIPLFLNNSGLTSSLPLFVKGLSYGTNPYINTDGYYPFEGSMTLFLKGTPGASLPLYLRAEFGSISGNIPLFIEANPFESGGIPLYMNASVPLTQNIPLYHHGF